MADDNIGPDRDIPDYTQWDDSIPYREYPTISSAKSLPATNHAHPSSTPLPTGTRSVHTSRWGPIGGSRQKLFYSIAAILGTFMLLFAAGVALLHSGLFSNSTTVRHSAPYTFSHTSCPFKPGMGITVNRELSCGTLTVPEDRSHLQGTSIHLAVAVFKSPRPYPASQPEVYLGGGPGGATLSNLGPFITSANLNAITLGHDLILLDQRGTGYSTPSLDCHEFLDEARATANQNLSYGQQTTLYLHAAQTCHNRLLKSGIHLNAYTTIANATDVHDLVHALNYKQVNLYGVSYGTRLALTVMRLFPADIRSVILDSTVPTQNNLFDQFPAITQHAFDTLFHGCASDQVCNTAYPQLDSVFYQLVKTLNAHPSTIHDVRYGPLLLTGDNFANWLFSALYITRFIPALPEIITQVNQGNYSLISQVYGLLTFENNISYGMYYSVECGEDMAFTNQRQLEQATSVLRPEIKSNILTSLETDYAVCQLWHQTPVPSIQKLPVKSSLPTLILSGEYDPITPPTNGQAAKQTLNRSFFFLFPATGHGVFLTGSCPDAIIANFLINPNVEPEGTCTISLPEPGFLSNSQR